jgi:hypothetical protein
MSPEAAAAGLTFLLAFGQTNRTAGLPIQQFQKHKLRKSKKPAGDLFCIAVQNLP